MVLPPPKCGEMEAFYRVLGAMELSAEFGYTTRRAAVGQTEAVEYLGIAVDRLPVAHVAIDIVAQEDEELGPIREHGLPDRLRPFLMRARAEGDTRQRRRLLG